MNERELIRAILKVYKGEQHALTKEDFERARLATEIIDRSGSVETGQMRPSEGPRQAVRLSNFDYPV